MRNKIRYFIRSTLLPNSLFLNNGKRNSKSLYLTFDDGPVQGVTEELLELLEQHQVKATFFIIGSRINKAPSLLLQIILTATLISLSYQVKLCLNKYLQPMN